MSKQPGGVEEKLELEDPFAQPVQTKKEEEKKKSGVGPTLELEKAKITTGAAFKVKDRIAAINAATLKQPVQTNLKLSKEEEKKKSGVGPTPELEKAKITTGAEFKVKDRIAAINAATVKQQTNLISTFTPVVIKRDTSSVARTVSLTSLTSPAFSNSDTPEPISDKDFLGFCQRVVAAYEKLTEPTKVAHKQVGNGMNITAPEPPFQITSSGTGNYQIAIPEGNIDAVRKIIEAVINALDGKPLRIDLKDPEQIKVAQELAKSKGISATLTSQASKIFEEHNKANNKSSNKPK